MINNSYKNALTAIIILSLAQSCGGDGENDPNAAKLSQRSISYSFSLNGCETGEHQFNSVDKYCDALKDQQFNKGCALPLRKEAFQQNCAGKAWSVTNIRAVSCGDLSCDGASQYCLRSYIGSADFPNTPECRTIPAGFNYEDSDLTCGLMLQDARVRYSGSNNCSQFTYCRKDQPDAGYALDCRVTL